MTRNKKRRTFLINKNEDAYERNVKGHNFQKNFYKKEGSKTYYRRFTRKNEKECVHKLQYFSTSVILFNGVKSIKLHKTIEVIGEFGRNPNPPLYHEIQVILMKKSRVSQFF